MFAPLWMFCSASHHDADGSCHGMKHMLSRSAAAAAPKQDLAAFSAGNWARVCTQPSLLPMFCDGIAHCDALHTEIGSTVARACCKAERAAL